MTIGENIAQRRRAADMTQEQLAEKVNVHQTMIAKIEIGRKVPGIYLATDIARALHCTLDELVSA